MPETCMSTNHFLGGSKLFKGQSHVGGILFLRFVFLGLKGHPKDPRSHFAGFSQERLRSKAGPGQRKALELHSGQRHADHPTLGGVLQLWPDSASFSERFGRLDRPDEAWSYEGLKRRLGGGDSG